ncbi:hypothetical protein C8R43DRAFT_994171 [Mycena crocata]|nr:hypothetical protein C8R43DRAFT_994171 [Mycena crocata]
MAFTLTTEHVHSLLDPVSEKWDWSVFLGQMDPGVRWVIGSEKKDDVRKTGIYNVASWAAEVAAPLGARLKIEQSKMTWASIDVVGKKAIVEASIEAVQLNGNPYNNRYVWILIFAETGKIIEVREYLDTALVQEVFRTNSV